MLARQLPGLLRPWRSLAAVAVIVAVAAPATDSRASSDAPVALKPVSYRGYTFEVPSAWPVIDLAASRRTCVRFDEHAIYLGDPARNQACPSLLVGTTEALLVQPAPEASVLSSVENPVAKQVTVTAPRIKITATFDADPGQIDQILGSVSLPSPIMEVPDPAAAPAEPAAVSAESAVAPDLLSPLAAARAPTLLSAQKSPVPTLSERVANYHGLGFDACAAPSAAYMTAWLRHSPYRAIGVYIGGADEACAQPNLTAGWLRREAAAGWHFIPMYVGPQAEFDQLVARSGRQGSAAADDAVAQAERLGFGRGTPIYYDMEAYSPGLTARALRFLSAWTSRLHRLGYNSGVYSSSSAGIAALARVYPSHRYAMPDVIFDALWNGKKNTADGEVVTSEWADHHRVHQFSGDVTKAYGGDAINIDEDYLNVKLSAPDPAPLSSAILRLVR
jgi:Rv2525c-like, glycoside hydrolase-like domain